MRNKAISFIDVFYPPFKKLIPIKTFRYAACGGTNIVIGFLLFKLFYQVVFTNGMVSVGPLEIKSYNIAFFLSSCWVFVVGFTLNKYIVFSESDLKGRVQLFRYFLAYLFSLFGNYFLLNLFVQLFHLDAARDKHGVVLVQLFVTAILIVLSYLIQHNFTFKIKNAPKLV